MNRNSGRITRFLKLRTIASIILVVVGFGLTLFFGFRALHAFRRMPLPPHPPPPSETDVETIRPWMNLKFVTQAYGVPPDYLLSYMELPPDIIESPEPLGEVNDALGWGNSDNGNPVIITRIKLAISEFYAHPGGPELQTIQPSMSIQFIATKAHVPAITIFEQIGIPKTGNEYKSLEVLSQEYNYKGGADALAEKIQTVLDAYDGL